MQTASPTLVAAIESKERHPELVVTADWLQNGTWAFNASAYFPGVGDIGDLTPFVVSVDVSRSLSTDLPEGAKVDTGYSAADATIVLAGSVGGVSLTEIFGAYQNPLSVVAPRIGAPVTIDMGFRGSAGVELLRQFTGRVRSCSVNPSDATVTLSCIDFRERFRTPVVLPVVVRDDPAIQGPHFYAQWMLDYIARKQGFYASPVLRASVIAAATLHGGSYPETGTARIGDLNTAAYALIGQAGFDAHPDGLMGLSYALHNAGAGTFAMANYTLAGPVNLNNGSTLFAEFDRALFTVNSVNWPFLALQQVGATLWEVHVYADTANTRLQVIVRRNGTSSGLTNLTLSSLTAGTDHYLGIQITMTAGGFVVQAKCDAVTGTVTGTVANSTGSATLDSVSVVATGGAILSGFQLTTEAYSAGMFNDGFVASAAFEESYNELTATPTVDSSDPWVLCQQIAAAEQGIFGFDELGVLRFYNRDHLTGGAAVATITTDPAVSFANLIQAASDESVDTVSNYVTVGAVPLRLDPSGTLIWDGPEVLGVIGGATLLVPVEFPGVVYSIQSLQYNGAQAADGTGGDVANLVLSIAQVSASAWNLSVGNPNAFDVFLVCNSTQPLRLGEPALIVTGQCVRPALESGYTAIRSSGPSQATYGHQPLDVPANVWRQSAAAADSLADHLVAVLAEPQPTLSGVTITGDPRLQLGDRVRVADPDGLVLDDDFWCVGLSPSLDTGSGFVQSVTLRQA